jgi:hypothetical protein
MSNKKYTSVIEFYVNEVLPLVSEGAKFVAIDSDFDVCEYTKKPEFSDNGAIRYSYFKLSTYDSEYRKLLNAERFFDSALNFSETCVSIELLENYKACSNIEFMNKPAVKFDVLGAIPFVEAKKNWFTSQSGIELGYLSKYQVIDLVAYFESLYDGDNFHTVMSDSCIVMYLAGNVLIHAVLVESA